MTVESAGSPGLVSGTTGAPIASSASPSVLGAQLEVVTGIPPLQSFAAQSAGGTNGTALDGGNVRSNHSLFVVASAGVTAGVITLQGSNDGGVTWFNTSCTVTTNAAGAFASNLQGFPFRYIRASITTAITGGTVTAYISSAG